MHHQPFMHSRVIDYPAHRRTLFAAALALAGGLHVHHAQATTLNVADDTEVRLELNTAPRGALQSLRVRATGTETKQTFVRFDTAAVRTLIPREEIELATLKVWVSRVDHAGNLAVHQVRGDWNEETLTLNNSPEIDNEFARVAVTSAAARQYLMVDVTPLVRAWVQGAENGNHGISLVPDSGIDVTIDSKENTATSHPMEIHVVRRGDIQPIFRSVAGTVPANATQAFSIDCLNGERAISGGWIADLPLTTIRASGPDNINGPQSGWRVTVRNDETNSILTGTVYTWCQPR